MPEYLFINDAEMGDFSENTLGEASLPGESAD